MKFFLVLAVCLLGIWLWRTSRKKPGVKPPVQDPSQALDMVGCQWCGVHVPKSEAQSGASGYYCSLEHRKNAET